MKLPEVSAKIIAVDSLYLVRIRSDEYFTSKMMTTCIMIKSDSNNKHNSNL